MKTLLMTLGAFALLPLALPAILVFVVVAALSLYWLVPVLWTVAAVYVIVKLVRWFRNNGALAMGGSRDGGR